MTTTHTSPVTEAERLTWQRRALLVLSDLLAAAATVVELPVLVWEISDLGFITGTCDAVLPAVRAAQFDHWADFLASQQHHGTYHRTHTDNRHKASTSVGDGMVLVQVICDIHPTELAALISQRRGEGCER